MKDVDDIEQFSFTEVKIILHIYFLDMKKSYTSSDLARETYTLPVSPYFRKIFNYLKEKEAIMPTNTYGKTTLYSINKIKLSKIIDKQDVIKIVFNYMENRHIVLETD